MKPVIFQETLIYKCPRKESLRPRSVCRIDQLIKKEDHCFFPFAIGEDFWPLDSHDGCEESQRVN